MCEQRVQWCVAGRALGAPAELEHVLGRIGLRELERANRPLLDPVDLVPGANRCVSVRS